MVRQLIELAVRAGGEIETDKVIQIQCRQSQILAFTVHDVLNGHHLAIAEVGTDQVRVVDPAVVDVPAGLHLCLQLLDNIAFLDQRVGQIDPGDFAECLSEYLGFVFVSGNGFRDDVDVHAPELLGSLDEPLHLLHLLFFRQSRILECLIHPLLGGIRILICTGLKTEPQSHRANRSAQKEGFRIFIVLEHIQPRSSCFGLFETRQRVSVRSGFPSIALLPLFLETEPNRDVRFRSLRRK